MFEEISEGIREIFVRIPDGISGGISSRIHLKISEVSRGISEEDPGKFYRKSSEEFLKNFLNKNLEKLLEKSLVELRQK